jgi:Tfp pilus assembly major pilin PilA
MSPIKQYISVLHSSKFYPGFVLLGANIILLIILIFIAFKAYDQYTYSEQIQAELAETKQNINLIRNNRSLLSERIDGYNLILEKLIPDDESYFAVISALDQLETRTGVSIKSYTINLESTTEDKLALQVNVEGQQEAIDLFLKEYPYISGRLLTSESTSLTSDADISYSFTLNFYHKKFENGASGGRQITEQELLFLDEISTRM